MKDTAIKEILINAKKLSETRSEDEIFEMIGIQMQLDKLTTNRRNLREENTELLNEIDCLILEVNDLKKQIKRMQHG